MALFKKTPTAPTTVAEAIAPFVQVKTNLETVMTNTLATITKSRKNIEDAKAYAAEVEAGESAAIALAEKQVEEAKKISDALSQILG